MKIDPSEITPEHLYLSRRRFIKRSLNASAAALMLSACKDTTAAPPTNTEEITGTYSDETGAPATAYNDIIGYTNYYEFSTSKTEPTKLAQDFVTSPWEVRVDGYVEQPRVFSMEDLRTMFEQEERVYRMRCVEAWSMVIPWVGFPLRKLLDVVKPSSEAKYVRFETIFDPEQMPGQSSPYYPWPYVEGLRMDEAMHDLALLATGIYGKDLKPQNGAPIRLVVPWKYGFKSIKSIVRIDLVSEMPTSLWMAAGPNEYGFYANVNPNVDHPRWSQATERRIGGPGRIDTLLFNGYEEEVSLLYEGMDLRVNF